MKFKFTLSNLPENKSCSEIITLYDIGYTEAQWNLKSTEKQSEILDTLWRRWAFEQINGGWGIIE